MGYGGGTSAPGGPRKKKNPVAGAVVGSGGGVGQAGQGGGTGGAASGYTLPPYLSYDPSVFAQLEAAKRGLGDTEQDVAAKEHYAQRDLNQALRDIRTNTQRKRGDINRTAFRAGRKFGQEEEDVKRKGERANQDFDTQLANIGRQFAQLGKRQGEAANSAGVLDTGTLAAGRAARGGNKRLAEAPIAVARGRLNEDLATALGRLSTGRADLGEDTTRSQTRLNEDRNRQRKLEKRKTGRELLGDERELERARREGKFSEADLIAQAIYDARQQHPGVYSKYGNQKKKGKK